MSKQNKQEPIDLDRAFDELDTEEERLKAEALGLDAVMSWEEIQTSGVAQLEQRELRKGLIPTLQRSLQVRRKELEIRRLEARIEPIERRQEELNEGLDEKRELVRTLQEEVNVRGGEMQSNVHRMQMLRSQIGQARREISDLKGGE